MVMKTMQRFFKKRMMKPWRFGEDRRGDGRADLG
jgi:hypothetical protein